ncbi:MAG: hypothetical protein HKL86_11110 [Acidimicrobiaceae bacterium]|nr:hypothetical protein [Acidimicrobiaceae bacterium]
MDVQDLLGKVAQHLSVSRAFGTAYEKDGSLVIPVAIVAGGGGAGEGTSHPPTSDWSVEKESDRGDNASGVETSTGSGGGFGGLVMPVGIYVVKDERVRWIPALNANLVIVVLFMTIRMLARTRRRSSHHRS